MLNQLLKKLQNLANPEQAEIAQRFFKTREGEYGEGDVFLGLTSQQTKDVAKKYYNLSLPKIKELLKSKIHEHRTCALRILVHKYSKANENERENIFNFYLQNLKNINNWDLVDLSAPNIVGDFLFKRDTLKGTSKKILYKLVQSKNLWERRIAIISTFAFIKKGEFEDALAISELLLNDTHDLIHKAVGWMLREVGKRDEEVLENFLKQHYKEMPRTMLRYSIERFEEEKRKRYLKGGFNYLTVTDFAKDLG